MAGGEPRDLDELWNLPRTQAEAREFGADLYFTGKMCCHGHLAARYAGGVVSSVRPRIRAATGAIRRVSPKKSFFKMRESALRRTEESCSPPSMYQQNRNCGSAASGGTISR